MARSRLYENALAALGGRRVEWETLERRIGGIRGPEAPNEDGADVVEMIQTENHLSTDPHMAAADPMGELLAALCDVAWPAEAKAFRDTYNETVSAYALAGRPIRDTPAQVYKYLNGPEVFSKGVLGALLDPSAAVAHAFLHRAIEEAETDPAVMGWKEVLRAVQDPPVWSAIEKDKVGLTRPGCKAMFVSYDRSGSSINRNSARQMHAGLALAFERRQCFVEVILPADRARPLKFPTFADAGWFRFFRSAGVNEPCGWTRPHEAHLAPQPEAVREPATLAEVNASSDLRVVPI